MVMGQPRRVFVREDYFDTLGPDQLYWLGFISADGSVGLKPRWALTVNLALRDVGHLEALRDAIGGTLIVKPTFARFLACSKRLVLRLSDLGVVPRKSYEPELPPSECSTPAFLRGMFDGDGCLHVSKRGYLQAAFCGNPLIVEWFIRACGVPHNGTSERGRTMYVNWTSQPRAVQLARLLYVIDGAPRLLRKSRIADLYTEVPCEPATALDRLFG
jgi:hypothetical protein